MKVLTTRSSFSFSRFMYAYLWAWSGPIQATNTSHSHTQHTSFTHRKRYLYKHYMCSPARVQHSYNDRKCHNTTTHTVMPHFYWLATESNAAMHVAQQTAQVWLLHRMEPTESSWNMILQYHIGFVDCLGQKYDPFSRQNKVIQSRLWAKWAVGISESLALVLIDTKVYYTRCKINVSIEESINVSAILGSQLA